MYGLFYGLFYGPNGPFPSIWTAAAGNAATIAVLTSCLTTSDRHKHVANKHNLHPGRTGVSQRIKLIYDLKAGLFSGGTSFTSKLFRLISRADSDNLKKLTMAYPDEVAIYVEFQDTGGAMFVELDDV